MCRHRQRSPVDGVIVWGLGPAHKWKLFENDEDCNVFLLQLCLDGARLALLPPNPLPHMFSITACIEAANISCASRFLYWALEIYFSNLWENYYVPCWENCIYGSCRETSSSIPVHGGFAVPPSLLCVLEQHCKNLLPLLSRPGFLLSLK